ncbi:hypothetical protein [Arsenicibacter rosenii]|uniref:Uncharacterized protein n=1 Tax=Arsenicibacter rosenii TaxID=1750698 RepID=A0A1S2VID4_9BACT|nr:hypothetical protein [Arsenicibacter rosenii]OIN58504.1 hypothetical protein BLX24_13085 [Arsenicibacter rosenii]
MKQLITLTLLLLALGSRAYGQYAPLGAISSWTDGYVITTANDTITGQIRIPTLINDAPASAVIKTPDGRKQTVKAEDLLQIAQRIPDYAYATGSIPRERQYIFFDKVPNPRRHQKPMLLERLSQPGKVVLYFDANGWKKTTDLTFGALTVTLDHKDFSFVAVKDGKTASILKKSNLSEQTGALFGDCPVFISQLNGPDSIAWKHLDRILTLYHQSCVIGPVTR